MDKWIKKLWDVYTYRELRKVKIGREGNFSLEREIETLLVIFSVNKSYPTLRPHELQHSRLPCPSLSPWVCSNSCPLSQWCHPTISFSVALFSSCPQSFPASGSFPMSQLFALGAQITGASASVLPVKFRVDFFSFRIDWLDLLAVQVTLKSLLQQNSSKSSIFQCSDFFMVQLSPPHMPTKKTIALTIWTFVSKVIYLLSNDYESLPLKTILHFAKECLHIFVSLKIFKAMKLKKKKLWNWGLIP